jgi:hypothetical protein
MIPRLEHNRISAQLSAVEELLATIPHSNFASRVGLEERRDELRKELDGIQKSVEKLASVALYFGGDPVEGSRAIEADFAANVLSSYQEIVTKVWSEGVREQSIEARKIPKEASHLHITDVVHGSFGFVLEEIDHKGIPLFKSALKEAMDKSVELILGIADQDEDLFSDVMAVMNVSVFTAVRNFYRVIRNSKAVFRLVEGNVDQTFDVVSVERAYERAEYTTTEEEEFDIEGELLGVIPIGRRFEFKRKDDGKVISGKVGLLFSQDYLDRVSKVQLTGRPCRGFFQKREIKKTGRIREVYVLTKLEGF